MEKAINRQDVLTKYLEWVEQISEELEDKSVFYPDEIVNMIIDIIEGKRDKTVT